jgi:hypothetical protein
VAPSSVSFIISSAFSFNGPFSSGNSLGGQGWYGSQFNGGTGSAGYPVTNPPTVNGATVVGICNGLNSTAPELTFSVMMAGTQNTSSFSSIQYNDTGGNALELLTSAATINTASYPGYTVFTWNLSNETQQIPVGVAVFSFNYATSGGGGGSTQSTVTAGYVSVAPSYIVPSGSLNVYGYDISKSCGSITPNPTDIGSSQITSAFEVTGYGYVTLIIAVVGSAAKSLFSQVTVQKTGGSANTYLTSAAQFYASGGSTFTINGGNLTVGAPGVSVWAWQITTGVTPVNFANGVTTTLTFPAAPPAVCQGQAGQASGGQTLTPNWNVNAPAGRGGDVWGAFGGGVTPINGCPPVLALASRCQAPTNFELTGTQTGRTINPNQRTIGGELSTGVLSTLTTDDALPEGGSNAG